MKNKKKNSTGSIVATVIPAIFIVASGIVKILAVEPVASKINEVGMSSFLPWLGMAEILFAVLFMFNRTVFVGMLLLSCYFSGAAATEVSHGLNGIIPLILLLAVWASGYFRNAFSFKFKPNAENESASNWARISF